MIPPIVLQHTRLQIEAIAEIHSNLRPECDRILALPDAELPQAFVQLVQDLRRYLLEF